MPKTFLRRLCTRSALFPLFLSRGSVWGSKSSCHICGCRCDKECKGSVSAWCWKIQLEKCRIWKHNSNPFKNRRVSMVDEGSCCCPRRFGASSVNGEQCWFRTSFVNHPHELRCWIWKESHCPFQGGLLQNCRLFEQSWQRRLLVVYYCCGLLYVICCILFVVNY